MGGDNALRQEIRHSLDGVRSRIRSHSGLYSSENLTRDVLRVCDQVTDRLAPDRRLHEARRMVEEKCRLLAQATDRFAVRDPVLIAASRAKAVAAIDMLQDAVLELHRLQAPVPGLGRILRQKSL